MVKVMESHSEDSGPSLILIYKSGNPEDDLESFERNAAVMT